VETKKYTCNDIAAKSTQVVNVAVATSPKEPSVDAANSVLSDLNNRIHTYIRSLLEEDAKI
jgi:capsular polysaccharide biosynthesis protein